MITSVDLWLTFEYLCSPEIILPHKIFCGMNLLQQCVHNVCLLDFSSEATSCVIRNKLAWLGSNLKFDFTSIINKQNKIKQKKAGKKRIML